MFSQTIALIRYQLVGIANPRLAIVLAFLLGIGVIINLFTAQLSLINSQVIALAVAAEFMRYGLVLLMMITISYQVNQDFELQFFERLLAMPVHRHQYVIAQFFLILVLALLLVAPMFLFMLFFDSGQALYWGVAVALELLLVGQITALIAISLEKLTPALVSSIAFYLFCKSLALIQLVLAESSAYYNEEKSFQFFQLFFDGVSYLLPSTSAFAQNNLLFESAAHIAALFSQTGAVLVYSLFVQTVILVDFYRKELSAR